MKPYNKANIAFAKKLRKEQTKWEQDLWYKYLRDYPVRFQRQKSIGNFIVDFYCAKAKLAIELDGYYHTLDKQYEDDNLRTEQLKNMGINIIRFKNSEIETAFEQVCRKIDAIVRQSVER